MYLFLKTLKSIEEPKRVCSSFTLKPRTTLYLLIVLDKMTKKKAPLKERRRLRKAQERAQHRDKLGSGRRFKALKREVAASGASNPAAVAAAIGRKKYGKEKMNALAKAGKH